MGNSGIWEPRKRHCWQSKRFFFSHRSEEKKTGKGLIFFPKIHLHEFGIPPAVSLGSGGLGKRGPLLHDSSKENFFGMEAGVTKIMPIFHQLGTD